MWLYRFIDPATRGNVPTFLSFLKWNHDLTAVCYEQTYLPQGERLSFIQRLLKFLFYLGLLMAFVFVVGRFEDDIYYNEMCLRREKCMRSCILDYYPRISCKAKDNFTFDFEGNHYTNLYMYQKPANTNQSNTGYNECASFALDNGNVNTVPETTRQARVHSCFPYCAGSNTFSSDCTGESLLCIPSSENCELSSPMGQVIISEEVPQTSTVSFSPVVAIFALLIVSPIQLVFELFAVIVMKVNSLDKESIWITLLNILMQTGAASAVCVILAYDAYCLITVQYVLLLL